MMQIKDFSFNHYGVNTYVIWDDTKECVLIDVGCTSTREQEILKNFITENNLKPVYILLTHPHLDHIAGLCFACETYQLPVHFHKAGIIFFEDAVETGAMMGFHFKKSELDALDKKFISDGDWVKFGHSQLEVRYTPGHADGSVCYVSNDPDFAVTGDVLFKQSIGRSDFPTGDYDSLMNSISTKLLTLPDDTLVFPGHGPSTTIKAEKLLNPFLQPHM